MTTNVLNPGDSRTGFLVDGDASTELISVTLRNDVGRIQLQLAWSGDERTAPYARWFTDAHGIPGAGTRPLPGQLQFYDVHGPVLLRGCRLGPSRSQIAGSGLGTGTVLVAEAVLGAGLLDYDRLHGMRSELVGLGAWVDRAAIARKREVVTDPDGRMRLNADVEVRSPDPARGARHLNMQFRPDYTISQSDADPDVTEVRQRMFIETDVKRARDWSEHLSLHYAIRDLLSVSHWRRGEFTHRSVMCRADVGHVGGSRVLPQWRTVVESAAPSELPPRQMRRSDYLFTYDDVGPTGVTRWIRLREDFARAIDPTISSIYRHETAVLTGVAEVGIGQEALGYLLARESGMSQDDAGRQSHRTRLDVIASSLTADLGFDLEAWADTATAVYNAVKHANRPAPDPLRSLNSWRKSVLVFRAWVGLRIGVPAKTIETRIRADRLYGDRT